MSLAATSYGVAAVGYSALAIPLIRTGLARRAGSTRAQLAFTWAVLAGAAWGWAGAAATLTGSLPLAAAAGLLDIARYGCWFHFALVLLSSPDPGSTTGPTRLMRALAAAVVTASAALLVMSILRLADSAAWTRHAPLVSLLLPVLGLVFVEHLTRAAKSDARWNIKPLAIGLASMFLFDLYLHSHALLFGRFDTDSLVARGFVHVLPVPLLYVATKRQHDWAQPVQISRTVAFHTATLVFVGAYLLLVSAMGYYVRSLGGDWGRALALALLSGALLFLGLLVFSGALRAKVRVFIDKNFFRYRYDYRSEWLRFTAMVAAQDTPREVGESVVRGLALMLQCRAGALWTADPVNGQWIQTASWNLGSSGEQLASEAAMTRFLLAQEWVVDLDELRAHPDRYADAEVPDWLVRDPAHWLVVPLIVGPRLIGFVVLARPHVPMQANWEVRDLLKTAGRQGAAVLALMQANDALLEARKFEAFNRMSAFVVHDLKNIVAQLSLMMQNARRLKDNPEFQEDMLSTVENSLEKMRRLMLQLREGNTPVGVSAGVALAPIVQRVKTVVRARGRDVQLQIDEPLVTRGHEERLERVIGHLVDNALDATESGGQVSLRLQRDGSQATLVVHDTGKGMSEEFIRTQLFKPFQTTKASGMGIGAYESAEYIKELGGDVRVNSAVGQGTTITVTLPLFHARADAAPLPTSH